MDFSKINIGLLNNREGKKKPVKEIFDVTPELEKKLAEIVARKKEAQNDSSITIEDGKVKLRMPSVNRVTDIKDVHRDVQDTDKRSFGDNYLISCNAAGVARRAIAMAVKGYTNMRMRNLDIRKWAGKIPYEGSANFMVDFMDKSGCPRSANIEVKIACGEAKEPMFFTDNKGNKYEMSHDGFDQMLGEIIDIDDIRKPEENVFEMPGKSLQLNAMKKKAIVVDMNDDEIDNWILNDEGLYNWALSSRVPEEEIGDRDSKEYVDFVDENRKEIVDGINKFLDRGPSASIKKKAQEDRNIEIGDQVAVEYSPDNIEYGKVMSIDLEDNSAQVDFASGSDRIDLSMIRKASLKKKAGKYTIELRQMEGKEDVTTDDIVNKLKEKFTTVEQFESRIDVHGMDVAEELGLYYDREDDNLIFSGKEFGFSEASSNKKADDKEKEEGDDTYEKPQEGEKVDEKYLASEKEGEE